MIVSEPSRGGVVNTSPEIDENKGGGGFVKNSNFAEILLDTS